MPSRVLSLSVVFVSIVLLTGGGAILGQAIFGSIQGAVTDPSGASIPDVKVTARNLDTGILFQSASNAAGLYLFGQLPPGSYEVVAEKAGFAKSIQQKVAVRVNDQRRLDIGMRVGEVTQDVNVTAEAPLVQTEGNSIGKVIEERTIKQLPLSGRNAFSLMLLAPGAQQTVVSNGTSGDPQPRLSGGRTRTSEFTIDGTSSTDPRRGDTVYSPNLDAIQEFSVQTEGIPAEYGRLTGGIVNATLKSGTNQFHGNLFEFLRNAAFDARNFFSATVPARVFNQFGGMVGGPIVRNRTFFFFDYQGTRNRQQSVFNLTVPTLQQRQGDFSQILGAQIGVDALGRPVFQNQIFDPSTTRTAPNGKLVRDPFLNNVIPSNKFDSAGFNVLRLYPLPTRPGLTQNYSSLNSGGVNQDQFDARVDQRFTDKDLFFARVSRDRQDNITARPYASAATGGSLGQLNVFWTAALDWTRTINPTAINDFRLGALRGELNRLLPTTDIKSLGIPNLPPGHLPNFTISGYDTLGDAAVFDPTQESYQMQDIVTLVRGRHILKFGADFRRFRINDLQLSANGQFILSRNETASPLLGLSGNPIASLLLGVADQFTNDPNRGRFYQRSNYLGVFAQDEFKFNSNFTLNIGLRYDVEQEPNETRWNGSNFDLISGQLLTMRQLGSNRIQQTKWTNLGPRIGIAWKPWGSKTVVRGSYGIFYTPLTGRATSAFDRWPQSQALTIQSAGVDPAVIISQTPASLASNPNGYGLAHSHDDVKAPVGYFEQWNFDLQREMRGQILLQATYVGSVGKHLMANVQYNEIPIQVVQANGGGSQNLRPYPNFPNIGTFCECQSSSYHALQLSAEKRYSSGVTFLASYTWSKFIDEQDDNFSSLFPESSYNRRLEKGLSLANIPQRFVFSSVYDLPFGKGRPFLSSGLLSQIVGGWQGGGILTVQHGQIVWINQPNNTSQTFSQQFRPNLIGNPNLENGRTLTHWFNTAAFVAPPPLTLGNSNKTPGLYGPHWINLDFSLHRDIALPLSEQTRIEIRGECFNCLNRANFNPPNGQFATAAFGQITAAQPGRSLQIAMKFWF